MSSEADAHCACRLPRCRADGTGKTAIQRARASGQGACERILREDRIAVEVAQLIESATSTDVTHLQELLRAGGKRIVNAIGSAGHTALYVAACAGNLDAVQILLENGALTNQLNSTGETALHGAAGPCVSE